MITDGMSYYDRVKEAADAIRERVSDMPEIAIVLGSGLGDFAGSLGDEKHSRRDSYGGGEPRLSRGHPGKSKRPRLGPE